MTIRPTTAALAVALALGASAQEMASTAPPAMDASAGCSAGPGPQASCTAPAGSVVELEVADALDSARNHRGDHFAIVLRNPLVVDGVLVLPAGVPGMGEVVHAAPSRGGGKPGELILAARHLDYRGQQVPLRGMKLGAVGQDRSQASLAVGMVLGPFGQLVHGRESVVPKGFPAQAKLAQPFASTVAPAAPAPPAVTPVAESPSTAVSN